MPTPTEPGWYWWQACSDVPGECRSVFATPEGVWGERIPDSSLDAFGGPNPSNAHTTGCHTYFGRAICIYCGAQVYGGDCDHTPDCRWLRAQTKPQPPAEEAPDADPD